MFLSHLAMSPVAREVTCSGAVVCYDPQLSCLCQYRSLMRGNSSVMYVILALLHRYKDIHLKTVLGDNDSYLVCNLENSEDI